LSEEGEEDNEEEVLQSTSPVNYTWQCPPLSIAARTSAAAWEPPSPAGPSADAEAPGVCCAAPLPLVGRVPVGVAAAEPFLLAGPWFCRGRGPSGGLRGHHQRAAGLAGRGLGAGGRSPVAGAAGFSGFRVSGFQGLNSGAKWSAGRRGRRPRV
jgi:hypothetical protein